jgi:hypothetical protein
MDNKKVQQFYEKRAKLPEEIKIFLESDAFEKILENIGQKYNIDSGKVFELVMELIIIDFNFIGLEKKISQFFSIDESQSEQVMIDILGMIFYPMEKYIPQVKASDILKKKKINLEDYLVWQLSLENELEKELDSAIKEFDQSLEDINWQEEKGTALEILNSNILEVFKEYSPLGQAEFNRGIALMLINVPEFREQAVRALLGNKEKLTTENIKFNEKMVESTVANWLKDYNYQFGFDKFDTLNLTKFISASPNCLKLSEEERSYVARLLQLFLNIKFFPDSLKDQPIEEWEFFALPEIKIEEKKEQKSKAQTGKQETTRQQSPEPDLKQKLANYDWDKIKGLERRALLEELGVSKVEFERWYKVNKL